MAVTLTTNWQNVAYSSWVPGTGLNVTFYLDAKYSTQNTTNNTTTIQTRLNCVVNSGYGSGYNYSFSCSYAGTVSGSGLWTLQNETITSGETTITHNQDGSKTLNLSGSANINGIGMYISFNGDVILPKIDRYAYITNTVQNPNDESTIWFSYNNPKELEMRPWLEVNPTGPHYASRTITNGGTSGTYVWELTTEERNQLRSELANSNNGTLRIGVYSTINNVQSASYRDVPFSIVNANPTLTHTEEETNSEVISLLGSSGNTVIQNVSVLRTTVTPTAYKEATISYVKLNSLDYTNTITTSPYVFDVPVKNNSFAGVVVDSRGNGRAFAFTKTLIEYKPVDITNLSMERVNPTSSDIVLNLEATYYQQNFGDTANVPTVKWKLDDGNYITIPSTEYTIDTTNNKLTISDYTLTNVLDYRNPGAFTILIEDLLTSDTDVRNVTKGIPTFDAGETDFKVNGDLYVADTDGQNKVNVLEKINDTKGFVLYNDTTGTLSTVTLGESSTNFTYLEIYYKNSDGEYFMEKVYEPNGKRTTLKSFHYYENVIYTYMKCIEINGTSITKNNSYSGGGYYGAAMGTNNNDNIYIIRVVGYK